MYTDLIYSVVKPIAGAIGKRIGKVVDTNKQDSKKPAKPVDSYISSNPENRKIVQSEKEHQLKTRKIIINKEKITIELSLKPKYEKSKIKKEIIEEYKRNKIGEDEENKNEKGKGKNVDTEA